MNKKILLIEDNLDMRENTAEILELANYDVVTAENGKKGVELAKQHHPDIIICDIMMPELDGYGVLFMLSKNPETAGIPFIFLTAKAEKSDLRKGMNLGADDYLTKPFEEMELLNAIESRLKKNEVFKKNYSNDVEGLNEFLEEAGGVEALEELSKDRKCRTYRKKDYIFHEGDYPNAVYFVNKGKVKLFKMNEEGKEYITSLFKPGDFLGYMSLLENSAYMESAVALEETEICTIPKDDFLSLIYNNRDVSHKFIQMLSSNLIEKEEQLLKLAYDTVRKRVSEALVQLQKKYQESADEPFTINVTRDDLASMVGTAKETVIRTLSDFKDEGLIDITSGKITLVQPDKLANLRF